MQLSKVGFQLCKNCCINE